MTAINCIVVFNKLLWVFSSNHDFLVRLLAIRYFQAVDHPVDLECTVESYPLPSTIEWTLNGHRLMDDGNVMISMQGDSHALVNTRLRIQRVQPKHFGVFACAAVNKLGFAQSEVRLLESQDPVCPPACGTLYSSAVSIRSSTFLHVSTVITITALAMQALQCLASFQPSFV